MKIHFLGTSGWYDTHENGSTMCTLIESKEAYIVFDAGFGIHKLGEYITDDRPIYLFISHFHLDHICGFHVFPRFKFPQGITVIYQDEKSSKQAFKNITSHPFCAKISEYRFSVKTTTVKPGGYAKPLKFECLPIDHTDPCLGYRLYIEDKVIVYCSDTTPCDNSVRLAQKADILIHESAMSPGKSDWKWGHSNPAEAAGIAKKANVKKLVLSHFAASGYDSMSKRNAGLRVARQVFSNTIVAKDGLTIKV